MRRGRRVFVVRCSETKEQSDQWRAVKHRASTVSVGTSHSRILTPPPFGHTLTIRGRREELRRTPGPRAQTGTNTQASPTTRRKRRWSSWTCRICWAPAGWRQGLTHVHFLAQPEPFLTRNTPQTHPTTPEHSLKHPKQPLNAPPVPLKALTLSRRVDECRPLGGGADEPGW